jgi:surface-anchored protein
MKTSFLKTLAVFAFAGTAAFHLNAQTHLWHDHTDVGVNYEDGGWDLHVHAEALGLEFAPDEAVLGVDIAAASNSVPSGASWSFLGSAGSPIWILPQAQNPSLLFLGFGTEELAAGIFTGDQVALSLKAVNGPGRFAVYETDMFGTPTVFMNSGDGISAGDSITLTAGGHRHVNWAFSAPGVYQIDFEGSGTLVDGNLFTSSGNVTYTFEVAAVPEPGSAALFALGAMGLLPLARRGKSRQ